MTHITEMKLALDAPPHFDLTADALNVLKDIEITQGGRNGPTIILRDMIEKMNAAWNADHAALQAALAEPSAEPFGWYSVQEDDFMTNDLLQEHVERNSFTHINGRYTTPLFTHPPVFEPLSDEEIADALTSIRPYPREVVYVPAEQLVAMVRAIEQAVWEKMK